MVNFDILHGSQKSGGHSIVPSVAPINVHFALTIKTFTKTANKIFWFCSILHKIFNFPNIFWQIFSEKKNCSYIFLQTSIFSNFLKIISQEFNKDINQMNWNNLPNINNLFKSSSHVCFNLQIEIRKLLSSVVFFLCFAVLRQNSAILQIFLTKLRTKKIFI